MRLRCIDKKRGYPLQIEDQVILNQGFSTKGPIIVFMSFQQVNISMASLMMG